MSVRISDIYLAALLLGMAITLSAWWLISLLVVYLGAVIIEQT